MRKSVDVSALKPMTNIFGDYPEDTRKLSSKKKEATRYKLLKNLVGRFSTPEPRQGRPKVARQVLPGKVKSDR